MRRLLVVGVVGAVLLATGIFGARLWAGRDTSPVAQTRPAEAATATVARTDLAITKTVSGQLGYGTERPVKAGTTGQVTWLPKFGRTITRGQPCFRWTTARSCCSTAGHHFSAAWTRSGWSGTTSRWWPTTCGPWDTRSAASRRWGP